MMSAGSTHSKTVVVYDCFQKADLLRLCREQAQKATETQLALSQANAEAASVLRLHADLAHSKQACQHLQEQLAESHQRCVFVFVVLACEQLTVGACQAGLIHRQHHCFLVHFGAKSCANAVHPAVLSSMFCVSHHSYVLMSTGCFC